MMQDALNAMLQAPTPVAGTGSSLPVVGIAIAVACLALGVGWWARGRRPLRAAVSADTGDVAQELARCQKEFDEFVYSVSHDLREPLRGMRNYAAFLTEDYAAQLDEDGRARLQTITRLVARMETQLDALHTLSRVARAPMQRVAVNLNDVAEAAGKRQQSVLALPAAAVAIEALPALECDPQWTTELFGQLIANALVFKDGGAASVRVGHHSEDASGHAVLFVRDDGIGIEARHHEDVFGLFRRLHGRDEYGGGIGAGLTIAQKIVERHGGRIWLESDSGAGTTVMFTLGAKPNA